MEFCLSNFRLRELNAACQPLLSPTASPTASLTSTTKYKPLTSESSEKVTCVWDVFCSSRNLNAMPYSVFLYLIFFITFESNEQVMKELAMLWSISFHSVFSFFCLWVRAKKFYLIPLFPGVETKINFGQKHSSCDVGWHQSENFCS